MAKYYVQSGTLQLVTEAVDARGAALWAMHRCLEQVLPATYSGDWQPSPQSIGLRGARGDPLTLTAKLQGKGGGTTNAKAAYFIWEMTNCSKEPGYAMNAPIENPSREFDMKIESGTPAAKMRHQEFFSRPVCAQYRPRNNSSG